MHPKCTKRTIILTFSPENNFLMVVLRCYFYCDGPGNLRREFLWVISFTGQTAWLGIDTVPEIPESLPISTK